MNERNFEERIHDALCIIKEFGGVEGGHHKQWVINQILRYLVDDYDGWIEQWQKGEDGPATYEWDKGIAP